MSFGDVIQTASSPSVNASGIGGDSSTIWHCDRNTDDVYELSVTDLSVIRNTNAPSTFPNGIGGDSSTIWHCNAEVLDKLYELSTVDFSVVRSANPPTTWSYGIGGDSSTIWYCNATTDDVYELSTTDFSVTRNTNSPSSFPSGIGGNNSVIWHCDVHSLKTYELSTTDFSVVRSVTSQGSGSSHIGGNSTTIWYCDYAWDDVYELDAAPTYTISGNVKDSIGNNLNNVTITLKDGTDYSTTTDASGNYSQVVNSDVYTVTASKDKYLDSSASVDATTGDQTQNFVLSKPVISGNIKDDKGYNINGVIVVFTNDASYDIITDSDGNYSQEVDPDEYNVAASLTGYLPDSADVDASSSDQTQDFTLDRTTVRDKGIRLGSRYLLGDIVDN